MESSAQKKIINALLHHEHVNKALLHEILNDKHGGGGRDLIRKITEHGVVSGEDLLSILSRELDMPPLDLTRMKLKEELVRIIPEKLAKKYQLVAVSRLGNHLTVAVSDPTDILAIDDVRAVTSCEINVVLATSSAIQRALRIYEVSEKEILIDESKEGDSAVELLSGLAQAEAIDIMSESQSAPVVKVVAVLISEAIKRRASDIHIEPQEKSLKIRYRIDGELYDAFDLPKKNQNGILARLKIMSNLDITENRLPQDGRFRIKIDSKEIDFRVSSLPTIYGNKIVLRILDKSSLSMGLESLGFLSWSLEDLRKALEKPYGIILVTGPTGSGKSTTLYAVLNELNVPEKNILTVEDPVEYQVAGITQMPTNETIGLDFASSLRAILRQAPDIILIGEIRDFETADIAIKASLTGHLVLSTLHTNDAIGAVTRLSNMHVESFLIASSLILTSAQRLLRKICPYCKAEAEIPGDILDDLRDKYPEVRSTDKFFVGKGCAKCGNTGYYGRFATLETILIDDEMRNMIAKNAPEDEMLKYLRGLGFRSLRENAINSFCKGMTTLDEVFRVT